MHKFSALTLALFFVIDALGHIPTFLGILSPLPRRQYYKVVLRELFFALIIMFIFYFLGEWLLTALDISTVTVKLAGGIILFLIAIRLIFSSENHITKWKEQPPFIVPLATPMIAGPSVLAVIMIFAKEEVSHSLVLISIAVAWGVSSILFLCAKPIYSLLKDSGLDACQRLMGLIVALVAIQMFINGVYEGLL